MQGTAELPLVTASGPARAIGRALGQAGRQAAHDVLLPSRYWQAVIDPEHASRIATLAMATRARFPTVWAELQGLAEGLNLPFMQVFAWNCRGDLVANTGDGCTTLQFPGAMPVIAHNEDGLPGFRGHGFLAHLCPDNAPGILSFCYPGSLAGHTFACTRAGLAQTVNNIRLRDLTAEIPRMVLGRAVLGCRTLDDACALLKRDNQSGGFHMSLAQAGDARLLSVEYGGGMCSVTEVAVPAVHANHALHLGHAQIVTRSSADRQARGQALLAQGVHDPRAILRDHGGPGLPIFRTRPDDPDDENTLATAVLRISQQGVHLEVLDQIGHRTCIDYSCEPP